MKIKYEALQVAIEAFAPRFMVIIDPMKSRAEVEMKQADAITLLIAAIRDGNALRAPGQIVADGEFIGYQIVVTKPAIQGMTQAPDKVFVLKIPAGIEQTTVAVTDCAVIAQSIVAIAVSEALDQIAAMQEDAKKKQSEATHDAVTAPPSTESSEAKVVAVDFSKDQSTPATK
jgi:hypothetical protein